MIECLFEKVMDFLFGIHKECGYVSSSQIVKSHLQSAGAWEGAELGARYEFQGELLIFCMFEGFCFSH